jgi:hypothetical protein
MAFVTLRLMEVRMKKTDEQYTEQEAQRRFLNSLRAALNTPPKPQKMMTRKSVGAQSKKRRKK